MAKVIILNSLKEEIFRKLKQDSVKVFSLMKSLEKTPRKGKSLCHVSGVVIKEIRYNKFRFYFITDGNMIKFGSDDELLSLLIKFVRMSEKKDQKKVIEDIKDALRSFGFDDI